MTVQSQIALRNGLREIIRSSRGRMVTVEFRKKNGELRKLNGRLGVQKGLNGGKNSTAHIPKYLTIFDVRKHGHRNVNLDTITYLAANGCKFLVMEG